MIEMQNIRIYFLTIKGLIDFSVHLFETETWNEQSKPRKDYLLNRFILYDVKLLTGYNSNSATCEKMSLLYNTLGGYLQRKWDTMTFWLMDLP
jgi:hypothetical protein